MVNYLKHVQLGNNRKEKTILIVIANTYHTPIDVADLSVRCIHSNDSSLSVSSRGVVANEPALVVALLSWRNQPLQGARSIVRMHLNTGTHTTETL
jgi:hypothetical protein